MLAMKLGRFLIIAIIILLKAQYFGLFMQT